MGDLIELPEDMTDDERISLQDYIKNGCPSLTKIKQSDIFQWFGLYMSGKTYDEIAEITKSKKDLVLYISHKSKWNEKLLKHYSDLAENIFNKTSQSKLNSADTILTIIAALNKYYGNKFNQFLAQNDKGIIEAVDTKLLSQYYKSLDTLDKLVGESGSGRGGKGKDPIVNVNIASGTVKQIDDNTVEITDEQAGDLLKILADHKKSSQNS